MKKLLFIPALLSVSCSTVQAADEPTEFRQAFAQHQREGTLMDGLTFREVQTQGWGKLYHDAIATRYRGTSVEGVSLEISPIKQIEVGANLALNFRLSNDSDVRIPVVTGGDCHVVHQATFLVLDPQGRILQGGGRIKAGGPHCFCHEQQTTLAAKSSVQLDTHTDLESVMTFTPSKPGKYVIIGRYLLPSKDDPGRSVYSAPLVLDVQ